MSNDEFASRSEMRRITAQREISFAQYDADVSARDAEIERLRARNKRLEEALRRLITEVDNESPWRLWPDAKIRAFDMARIALEEDNHETGNNTREK